MTVRRTRHLRPRLPVDLVARSRLIERLNRGLHQPLLLIATPAGFGKTTLLCEWLAQSPIPSAWLSLDEQGEDLASFVTNAVLALEGMLPTGARETLGLLRFPTPPAPKVIAARLADEMLDLPDDVILVLDDYHAVSDARIHEFLTGLLEHPAPGLHIVLATRVDPPLPLARLRARGQMTELRAADLRFTAEETTAFLGRTTHRHIDPAAAVQLGERTEGWAAGLRLAALSLDGREPVEGVFSAFQGRRLHHVMEFLTDEVLDRQPPEMQDFLLRTSIVERLCAPHCDALLAGEGSSASSEAMLSEAVRAHLYLDPLGDEQHENTLTWYRYHQLFRDVLRRRLLTRLGADGVAMLHARASRWFAGEGLILEAIGHAFTAGDRDGAIELVEANVHPLMNREEWVLLDDCLRLLPQDEVERRPRLILAGMWIAMVRNQFETLHWLTERLASMVDAETATSAELSDELRGAVNAFRGAHAYLIGDIERAVEAAAGALAMLPDDEQYLQGLVLYQFALIEQLHGCWRPATHKLETIVAERGSRDRVLVTRLLFALAVIYLQAGEVAEARQAAERLLRLASAGNYPLSLPWAHYWLGAIAYETDDLDAAIEHFSWVVAHPNHANLTALRDSVFGLALSLWAQGRVLDAEMEVGRFKECVTQSTDVEQMERVRAFEVRLALLGGAVPAETQVSRAAVPTSNTGQLAQLDNPELTWVKMLIALGTTSSLREAEATIASLLERVRDLHHIRREIEVLALQSLLLRANGREAESLVALEQSIALAAPGGFVRMFVDLGPPMAELLTMLRERSKHRDQVGDILARFPNLDALNRNRRDRAHRAAGVMVAGDPSSTLPESLTDREAEILNLLQLRLSNKDIAGTLVISPLTVKTHASNIYGKLGVTDRREAIRKARALGLVATAT